MTDNTHSLTGAYVLDALDPVEAAAFRAHLAECTDCRDEVSSLRAAATRLAGSATVVPPRGLRDDILKAIAVTPQSGPATPTVPTHRRASARRRWPAVAVAAAMALLAVVGGTALYREREAALSAVAMQNKAMRIASAPDAVSMDVELGATHLVMSYEMQAAALMGQDVPMPTPGRTVYQVWMMHADGSAAPGPTFLPHDGELMLIVEGDFSDVTEFAVSIEPRGGSPSPSGPMVVHVGL